MKRMTILLYDSQGPSSTEYALIAALLSVFIVGAVASLGAEVLELFHTIATAMP